MVARGDSAHSLRPLNQLLTRGFEVTLVDRINPYPKGRENFHFFHYPFAARCFYRRFGPWLGERLADWACVRPLARLRKELKPDVTHVHWVDCHAYYCLKAGLRPLVLSVWGSDVNNCFLPGTKLVHKQVVGKALAGASTIIVDSKEMVERCANLAGGPVHTQLLHLGVDTRLFKPGYQAEARQWRKKLNLSENAKVLLSIRGLSLLYRHHLILKAFAKAQSRLKSTAYLVFKVFNAHDPVYLQSLQQLSEALGISQQVRWLEEVPFNHLPELYALSDIVINFPSQDTFPVTFLEAAACEKRVITCRLPGYQDTFAERYFHMVESDQVSDLADAIINELDNDNFDVSSLSKARLEVMQQYDETLYIEGLLKIYHSLATLKT